MTIMKSSNLTNLALIAGGKSKEREVSLKGALEVEKALDKDKFNITRYDPATDLGLLVRDAAKIDVAFILLHGLYGEDGTVQGFLDLLGIPYQGSGVLGSSMAIDKDVSKQMYRVHGLPVADWIMVNQGQSVGCENIIAEIGSPVVVKPVREGSSLGMSIASSGEELASSLDIAFNHDKRVMIEKFIRGREITAAVIGNDTLSSMPLVEVIPGDEYNFFDYVAKYQPGATKEICPAPIDDDLTKKAQEYARRAHSALNLRGYSRTDMMITEEGQIYLLETNTIPGMTPTSLLPQATAEYGLSFSELLEKLIELACSN